MRQVDRARQCPSTIRLLAPVGGSLPNLSTTVAYVQPARLFPSRDFLKKILESWPSGNWSEAYPNLSLESEKLSGSEGPTEHIAGAGLMACQSQPNINEAVQKGWAGISPVLEKTALRATNRVIEVSATWG